MARTDTLVRGDEEVAVKLDGSAQWEKTRTISGDLYTIFFDSSAKASHATRTVNFTMLNFSLRAVKEEARR